jgi:hypothetical protein
MPGRLIWLVIWTAGLAFAVPSSQAADPGEETRLRQDMAEASKRLHEICLYALDKQAWAICLIRGWSYLERGKYSSAKADFQLALQLSKTDPKPEVHEAMALLLAACPDDRVRNGVSVHGVVENHHGVAEKMGDWRRKERRQGPDGRSEGGKPPPK